MNRSFAAASLVIMLVSCASILPVFSLPTNSGASNSQPTGSHELEGIWQGRDEAGEVRVTLRIKKIGTDVYSGTLQHGPDPAEPSSPTGRISIKDADVHVVISAQGVHWDGKLNAAGTELTGNWTEGTDTSKFNFKRFVEPSPGPDTIEGIWKGTQADGGESMHFVLEFERTAGGWVAALQMPEKFGTFTALKDVTLVNGKVHFGFFFGEDQWNGTLNASGTEMVGKRTDGVSTSQVTWRRALRTDVAPRPQEPTKPLPYSETDVVFESGTPGIKLGGTLTTPASPATGPYPAVMLMSGKGDRDRNGDAYGHKPQLVLADFLTRHGIAVLRVDDRGIGASTGDFDKSTAADCASDLLTGVAYLKTRADIAHGKIGIVVFGGGSIAASIAAAQSKDIAFITLLNAPGVKGGTVLFAEAEGKLRAAGASETVIKGYRHFQEKVFNILASEKGPNFALAMLNLAMSDESLEETVQKIPSGALPLKSIATAYNTLWMRYYISNDPGLSLKRVTCPVLAISGDKDMDVPPALSLPIIEKLLKTGGNSDVTTKLMPGLNHLLQTCKSGLPNEYAKIDETIAPAALQTIGDWIAAHTK